MWSVSLKHYKCKEDWSGSYIIHDGRLRAGYARVTTRQGVERRKKTKNTLQYFEDEADYRLLLVSMQVSIIILILRAESPILQNFTLHQVRLGQSAFETLWDADASKKPMSSFCLNCL